MAPTARPTAVVLDLGNVVIRWDPLPALVAGVGEEEAAAFLADDDVDFGSWNHAQDLGRPWAEAQAWLAEHHARWIEHGRAYREHFDRSLVGLVDGTAEVLRAVVAAGVPAYALTNWSAETFPVAVERFGDVLHLFDDVVVSGEVGLAKPDPAVYDLAARRLGHPPEALFFTDDSPANVEAALAAGWDATVFTDSAALAAQLHERGLLPGGDAPVGTMAS